MEFSERIERIMRHYGLNSKELADKCGVQRTAINHILNGRNRPSVGFLSALSESFPELNTRWLLHGKGAMFTNVASVDSSDSKSDLDHPPKQYKPDGPEDISESSAQPSLPLPDIPFETNVTERYALPKVHNGESPQIVQVIVCYSDGSCRSYRHQE